MNMLSQIIRQKQKEVNTKKERYPEKLLEASIYFETPVVSLSTYVQRPDKSGIIAEFKRKSPSKGNIAMHADVEQISIGYMQANASALSILTDESFFGGSNEDLKTARKFNFCPILRKDFIIDAYQIIEAKSIGADAILLIAAILSPKEVQHFARKAKSLGLEVLLEIHSASELDHICPEIDLVGVNNRNLEDFQVDLRTSLELSVLIPKEFTRISESGIQTPEDIHLLRAEGYEGFLIGEQFMKAASPHLACAAFIQHCQSLEKSAL